jgi:L-alanine-DL-glutamate epimerase-like enolase superfamily enzyme
VINDASVARVDLFSYEASYVGGELHMSGGRVFRSLSSTVVRIQTADGRVGYGESCPLGSNYLPGFAGGVRAALTEIAPRVIGLDAGNPAAVYREMDAALLGHGYAKSALDIACWDVFGQLAGVPLCDLLGGRQQRRFPLYELIALDTPERMSARVELSRARGVHRFQLKVGGDPVEDAERVRAVVDVVGDEDLVFADANGGWSLPDAITATALLDDVPRLYLEQPCRTYEECLQVHENTPLPMFLDEVIVDLPDLLRAWNDRSIVGINLKISRVGGLTPARVIRDTAQELGLIVNIEDTWGGDIITAAVSHLAASSSARTAWMVSFINDWTNEHLAGYEPRSSDGHGSAPTKPGLGITVDEQLLGEPFASFSV